MDSEFNYALCMQTFWGTPTVQRACVNEGAVCREEEEEGKLTPRELYHLTHGNDRVKELKAAMV